MKLALAALALPLLTACERAPAEADVTVEAAVVTLPAIPGRPGAAYFTLRTDRERARLVAVTSPSVGRIELHESTGGGGVSRMAGLSDATFSPGRPLVFAPGGRHAMLFDLDPALRPGERVALTFAFEASAPVTVEAPVRGPGDVH